MSAHNAATTEMLEAVVDGNVPVAKATAADTATNAGTASALGTNAGSDTRPVYFQNGVPVQCGNTLNVNISGNAAAATNATHAQSADTATKASQDASGNDIVATYATKAENAAKLDAPTVEQFSIPTTSWTALSGADPFTVSATVTATTAIGADATIELYNDQPVAFSQYCFSIASVSGQTLTIYALETPTSAVTLMIGITN